MANLVVYEFKTDGDGDLVWPAARRTALTSAATLTTQTTTKKIVVCSDVSCRINIGPDTATASDYPVIGAVANPFNVQGGENLVSFSA